MTADEYDDWLPGAVTSYANEHVRAGSMPADQAQQLAKKQFVDLLPDGLSTSAHHLLTPELDGTVVGLLWLHIPVDADHPTAFIYDVEVDEEMRGRGLGRAVMIAGEHYARARGAVSMRLHVFGTNVVARHLYESLGYDVTNVMMAKSLDPGS